MNALAIYFMASLLLFLGAFLFAVLRYGVAPGYWSWAAPQPLFWLSLAQQIAMLPIAAGTAWLAWLFRQAGKWIGALFELLELACDRASEFALSGAFKQWNDRARRDFKSGARL